MSLYTPFRFLIAVATALLIATAIVSSSAHALLLGDAVSQSTLGMPLRAVIPVRPAPGEVLEARCFRLVPTAAGTGAPIVTGRVSLERAAATPRLIVTTPNPINEPAVQFAIQAECNGTIRRNYALLLDPPAANATATLRPTPAREPGQERSKSALSTARRSAVSPSSEPRAAPRAVASPPVSALALVASPAVIAPAAPREIAAPAATSPAIETSAVTGSHAGIRRVAAPARPAVGAPTASRGSAADDDGGNLWWYLAAPLVVIGAIALGTFFVRRHRAALAIPEWTRGTAYTGPRSVTDMSATPVTLSHAEHSEPTQRPISSRTTTAPRSLAPNTTVTDVSMLDTLLNTSDADLVEERAVREAFAAARSDIEREADDNAVLRAIEEAERELLFAPPMRAQAAIDTSLDDDLLSLPRRQDKAAA